MKGIKAWICGLLAVCVIGAPLVGANKVTASAEGEMQKLADFSEDFESYDTSKGYIENDPSFAEKWTNNVLKKGEAQGMDAHLTGIAKVEYENGSSGNKVLRATNASIAMNTFFHIDPANDYRVKNFTAGFKLKFMVEHAEERGWVGLSFRKKATSHYTGTNNLMFTVERYTANTKITAHSYAVFNGGSPSELGSTAVKDMFGDKLTYTDATYDIPNAVSNQDTPWVDFRLEVNGNTYKTYVDDTLMADCVFDVPTFDYFGYLSLNCCTADIQVDDFYVTVKDTELPPVIGKLATPVVTLDEANKKISWEHVDGANLYKITVDGEEVKTTNKNNYKLDDLKKAGTYKIAVQALSEDLFVAYNSDLSAEVTYTVSGGSAATDTPTEEKKGCGSVISGGLALAAVGVLALAKKRKEEK